MNCHVYGIQGACCTQHAPCFYCKYDHSIYSLYVLERRQSTDNSVNTSSAGIPSSGVVVPDKQLKMAHQSKHGVVKLCRCWRNSVLNIAIHGATMSALGGPHVK